MLHLVLLKYLLHVKVFVSRHKCAIFDEQLFDLLICLFELFHEFFVVLQSARAHELLEVGHIVKIGAANHAAIQKVLAVHDLLNWTSSEHHVNLGGHFDNALITTIWDAAGSTGHQALRRLI